MGTKKIVDAERLNGAMTASAEAIRAKTGGTAAIPWDMDTGFAGAIGTIPTGGSDPVIQPLSVTANGTYTAPEGVDGYSPVTVNVPADGSSEGGGMAVAAAEVTPSANSLTITFEGLPEEPKLFVVQAAANITLASTRYITGVAYDGEKTAGACGIKSGSYMSSTAYSYYSETAYTWEYADGTLTITADSASSGGYFMSGTKYTLTYATGSAVSEGGGDSGGITPSGTIEITENGTYDVTNYASAEVNVSAGAAEPELEEITITANGEYLPTGDGFSKVTVNVPSTSTGLPDTITAGNTPVLADWEGSTVSATTETDTGLGVSVPKAGTWRFKVIASKSSSYGTGTSNPEVYIYRNNSKTKTQALDSSVGNVIDFDVACTAGDTIKVYAKAVKSTYSTTSVVATALIACVNM